MKKLLSKLFFSLFRFQVLASHCSRNQIAESRFALGFCTFDFLVLGFLRNLPSVPWTEQFRTSAVLTRKEKVESRIFC